VTGDPFDDAVAVDPAAFDPNDTAPASRVAGAIARSLADAATVQSCTVVPPPRAADLHRQELARLRALADLMGPVVRPPV